MAAGDPVAGPRCLHPRPTSSRCCCTAWSRSRSSRRCTPGCPRRRAATTTPRCCGTTTRACACPQCSSCPPSSSSACWPPTSPPRLFFKNSLEETRSIALVLTGLIWLVIPMAWTYLNDRVFYAHQMTWMTFRLQCVTTSLSTVGALVAPTLDPDLTAFTLSLGQALAYVVSAGVGFSVLRRRHGHLGLRGDGDGLPQARGARAAHRAGPVVGDPRLPARPRRDPRGAGSAHRRARPRGGGGRRAGRHLGRGARPRRP